MISGPLMRKKKAPVSFATARAIKVFPLPGGPYRSTPRGGFTPRVLNKLDDAGAQLNHLTNLSQLLLASSKVFITDVV